MNLYWIKFHMIVKVKYFFYFIDSSFFKNNLSKNIIEIKATTTNNHINNNYTN